MELISNAAEKMMNATVKCELTSSEVWTSAKTAIKLFGASLSRFANKSTNYGIIDLTARRDDGRFWDLGTREDRERLEQMQQEHQTELLIGSGSCISFRTLLYPSGTKTQIDRVQDQELQYTRACIEAYKRQLIMGRHFLHEHPLHASSWCMPEMRELMNDEGYTWCRVRCVTGVCRRLVMATSRNLCVETRDGRRAAQGWQLCWQENMLEKIVEYG